jgi:hypothetical protein
VTPEQLSALNRGFRQRYLQYRELTEQLEVWAKAFPSIVRLRSIGKSVEGRDLWLLVLGTEPDRPRPAVWVDGNMHAIEVAGSSVALAIAEDVIALHLGAGPKIAAPVARAAKEALFYVLPRMSPDGAEAILTKGNYVRSVPRDERSARGHARWINEDANGDGACITMRKIDEAGEYVAHPSFDGLMLSRTPEDEGPYYKIYPEGRIENFDGRHIPDYDYLGDNYPDLNRNFPWLWIGEHRVKGAGDHPGSEPESRAVIQMAQKTPNLFVWSNLHTFGGVMIRPPGDTADSRMNQRDLALYRQLEHWSEEICGYPMVGGFEEFLYAPDEPVRGALAEWAYVERGCLSWVTELWDIFAQIGMKRPKRFVDYYDHMTRADIEALARFDRERNAGRLFRPYVPFVHPQIGECDIGGLDTRVGLSNPPYEALPEVCDRHSRMFLHAASLIPRVTISRVEPRALAEGVTLIEIDVENRGYLPTYGVHASAQHAWNEKLRATFEPGGGLTLDDPAQKEIGHLAGWGRGRFSEGIFFQRSSGSVSKKTAQWVVRGHGSARIRVESARVGSIERAIEIT